MSSHRITKSEDDMGEDIVLGNSKEDQRFMRTAIEAARIALENGDVPICSVNVDANQESKFST
jgi:hypothetical protein